MIIEGDIHGRSETARLDHAPAYRYGVDSYGRHSGRRFDEVESDLSRGWEQFKGKSKLTWERAKAAVRDAWDRMTD